MTIQTYHGDCLEIMEAIPDKTVDMVLCDLPYGTTKNSWDEVIPMEKLWDSYHRIVRGGESLHYSAKHRSVTSWGHPI